MFSLKLEGRSIFIISIVEHPKNFKKEKENQRKKCICTAWTLSWMFLLFSLNGHKFLLFSLDTKETFLQGMSVAFKRWSSTRKIIICDFPIVVQICNHYVNKTFIIFVRKVGERGRIGGRGVKMNPTCYFFRLMYRLSEIYYLDSLSTPSLFYNYCF